jgi:hypothetical protein
MERTKYHFPAVRLFVAVAAMSLIAGRSTAQSSGREVADGLKLNVVKIEAVSTDHTENGFGFILGERSGALYIATANHVVNLSDAADLAPAKVKVQFYDHQGTNFDATIVTHDVTHDLAVLTVVPPQGFEWKKRCLGRTNEHQKLGTEVWNIGKTGAWSVPVSPGHIATEEIMDGVINVETLSILPGSSGGPLVAPSGIVGLILRDDAGGTTALSITYVKLLFKNWVHPWNAEVAEAAAPAASAAQAPSPVVPAPAVAAAPLTAQAPAVNPLHEAWYELYTQNGVQQRPGVLLRLRKVSDDYFLAESTTPVNTGWSGELRGSGNAWDLKITEFRGPRQTVQATAYNPGSGINEISKEGPLLTFKTELGTAVWKETERTPVDRSARTTRVEPTPSSAAEGASRFLGALLGGVVAARTTTDRCQSGYVWREAHPNDHVCVTEETRRRTAIENSTAASRRDPYGPGTCLYSYVWREAVQGDRVCVTPESRMQAYDDNRRASSRVAH